jgi:hypothetical protein
MNTNRNPGPYLWILFALALVCYLIPWLVNPGMSLTLGGYDLAEWISLRLPDRPMDSVMLLRLPPVLIAVMIALIASRKRFSWQWWLGIVTVLFIAIALLPPFEFFLDSGLRGDVNYSQQFNLAVYALIGGAIGLSGLFYRWRNYLIAFLCIVTAGISLSGWSQAQTIMQTFQLPVHIGAGIIGLIASLGGIIVLEGLQAVRSIQKQKTTPST